MRVQLPPPDQRNIEIVSADQLIDIIKQVEDESTLVIENGEIERLVVMTKRPYAMVKLRENRRGGPVIYAINPQYRESLELFQINDEDEVPLSVCIPFEWVPTIAANYFRTGKVPTSITWLGPDHIRGFGGH